MDSLMNGTKLQPAAQENSKCQDAFLVMKSDEYAHTFESTLEDRVLQNGAQLNTEVIEQLDAGGFPVKVDSFLGEEDEIKEKITENVLANNVNLDSSEIKEEIYYEVKRIEHSTELVKSDVQKNEDNPQNESTKDKINVVSVTEEMENVAQRIGTVLKYMRTSENIKEIFKEPFKDENGDRRQEINDAFDSNVKSEDTLESIKETGKTVELLEESKRILTKLEANLKALQEKVIAKGTDEVDLGRSAHDFEKPTVSTSVPNLILTSSSSIEELTISLEADPCPNDIGPTSRFPFLQRVRHSVRKRADSFCFVCACSFCLLCLFMCRKR